MAAAHGIAGVVATGIPEKGYDGPEAERMRQAGVVGQLREVNPDLYKKVAETRAAARAAQARWDTVRLELAAAVGPGAVHDVLAVIDQEATEAEKRAAPTVGENRPYRAPDYALSEEDQRARRERDRRK